MATLPHWPYPRLCAHRGAGKLAPENTLTAMRVGHAHGYGMVEFDVKLSGDNVAFLLHDATLERTTSGRGRADALPSRSTPRRCGATRKSCRCCHRSTRRRWSLRATPRRTMTAAAGLPRRAT